MEQDKDYYSLKEIGNTVRHFTRFMLKRWWLAIIAFLLSVGIGLLYYYQQPSRYIATTTFILEEKSSGSGGLSGLASQFGFNIGSAGGGGMFAGDNILDILRSKKVIYKVLMEPVGLERKDSNQTLIDYYLEFTEMKKGWSKKPQLAAISYTKRKTTLTPIEDSILNVVYSTLIEKNIIAERIRKQSNIISVKVICPDAFFSRTLSRRLVEEASELYLNVRTGTSQENIRQLQSRADSLLYLLNSKSFAAANTQLLDVNPGFRIANVPAEIVSRDKTVLATVYAEVVKNLEASKLLLAQQTPIIQLLDQPDYLLKDFKKRKLIVLLISAFSVAFVYVTGCFLVFYFGKKRKLE